MKLSCRSRFGIPFDDTMFKDGIVIWSRSHLYAGRLRAIPPSNPTLYTRTLQADHINAVRACVCVCVRCWMKRILEQIASYDNIFSCMSNKKVLCCQLTNEKAFLAVVFSLCASLRLG